MGGILISFAKTDALDVEIWDLQIRAWNLIFKYRLFLRKSSLLCPKFANSSRTKDVIYLIKLSRMEWLY